MIIYTEYDILYQNKDKLDEIIEDTKDALEMMKSFMRDDMKNCAKVRKQILKGMEIDYFKKNKER